MEPRVCRKWLRRFVMGSALAVAFYGSLLFAMVVKVASGE